MTTKINNSSNYYKEVKTNSYLITKEHMWILSSTSVGLAKDNNVNYPIGVLGKLLFIREYFPTVNT
jgi:hypothetical protein